MLKETWVKVPNMITNFYGKGASDKSNLHYITDAESDAINKGI